MIRAIAVTAAAALFLFAVVTLYFQHPLFESYTNQRVNCPTRNMSYDLRGEAAYPRRVILPYLYSTIGPEDPRECIFRGPI